MSKSESICRKCFHSYVCEQFNEHREWDNKKCHFANDHFISADIINRLQAENSNLTSDLTSLKNDLISLNAENERLKHESDVSIEDIHSLSDQVNEQQEEIGRLSILAELGNTRANDYRVMRDRALKAEAENDELVHKLECLLCHSTGGKLSKHIYPLDAMERCVNDTIQEYCEEAQAEAHKEFAEKLCEDRVSNDPVVIAAKCLLKELMGDDK